MTFEDFCAYHNIVVVYWNFTTKIRGLCMKADDYYIVALNPKFCSGMQKKTFEHEVMHIMKNHFSCDASEVEKCEEEIHNIRKSYDKIFN